MPLSGERINQYDMTIISEINPYQEARTFLKNKYQALLVRIDCDMAILRARDI